MKGNLNKTGSCEVFTKVDKVCFYHHITVKKADVGDVAAEAGAHTKPSIDRNDPISAP